MIVALAFVVAAAVGAVVRLAARALSRPGGVPVGTIVPNVAGAFLLGVIAGWGQPVVTGVGVGFLGSLTTFSSFAAELATLPRRSAALYGALTLGGGIGAAWLGLRL